MLHSGYPIPNSASRGRPKSLIQIQIYHYAPFSSWQSATRLGRVDLHGNTPTFTEYSKQSSDRREKLSPSSPRPATNSSQFAAANYWMRSIRSRKIEFCVGLRSKAYRPHSINLWTIKQRYRQIFLILMEYYVVRYRQKGGRGTSRNYY